MKQKVNSKLFFLLSSIALVITGYVWFITYGYWTNWNPSTYFYDELATAFSHGSLALEADVNPELLSLKNPYNPYIRKEKEIIYPLDYSLYNEKYYLYFGPVPALFLVVLKFMGFGIIGDHPLTFAFICGMFIFEVLIILHIHKNFFRSIPDWVVWLCILFIGLTSPTAWLLTDARVYEVALAAGQTFFLAGFYFNITAISKDVVSLKRLLIGGILWAFAIGSRLSLVLTVGFVALAIVLFLLYRSHTWKLDSKIWLPVISLFVPILAGGLLLAWYNWARFGSIFETGFYYQLTSSHLQKFYEVLFSPIYILPNSYEYLIGKPKLLDEFPFLQPVRARGALRFPFINLPAVYHTRAVTGIIYSSPFIIFAGFSIFHLATEWIKQKQKIKVDSQSTLLNFIIIGLFVSFVTSFFTIVSYFWVELRFITEFSPSLYLFSIIGFFIGYRFFSHKPILVSIYLILGVSLILVSIITSSLLVFGFRAATYQDWNPTLWNHLYNFFTP